MSLTWKYIDIDFNVPSYATKTNLKGFIIGRKALIIGVNENNVTICYWNADNNAMRCTTHDLEEQTLDNAMRCTTHDLEEQVLDCLEVSEAIYVVGEKHMYRISIEIPTAGVNTLKEDLVKLDEVYCWSPSKHPAVCRFAGLHEGIAVVASSCVINIFNMQQSIDMKVSLSLPGHNDICYISTLNPATLDKALTVAILLDRSLFVVDIILFATKRGCVSVLPLLSEHQNTDPIDIHLERDTILKDVFVSNDGKTLILAFRSGNVVLLFADPFKKLKYSTFLLMCNESASVVQSFLFTGRSEKIYILWSSGIALNFAVIENRLTLKIIQVENYLYGIRFLFKFNEEVLGFNCNGSMYKIKFDTKKSATAKVKTPMPTDLKDLSTEIEEIKVALLSVNQHISAVQCEQAKDLEFSITTDSRLVTIKNQSSFNFIKDRWLLSVEGFARNDHIVKIFPLEDDLMPNTSKVFSKKDFVSNGCESINISLQGHGEKWGSRKYRNLYVRVGTMALEKGDKSDVFEFINEKLDAMCNTRNLATYSVIIPLSDNLK